MSETRTNTTRWLLLAGFVCLIGFDQVARGDLGPSVGRDWRNRSRTRRIPSDWRFRHSLQSLAETAGQGPHR